ncbi:DNA topoisomerase [Vibrio sp. V05_P4A8T149]|nr:DNA topoisomerase [Vibrio sp. V24_P1S3T111]NOI06297.1 DNA topoisomerase [Vibrio anguillarum]OXX19400.1 DNA topoisomerase [Vibrio sp. V05_P4A8T149]OXX20506.1 DNA topoisomerase [Vibrio sp. V06_P1A73T115]OXX32302.1 DNA topoisomerase [Vibrio sp. V14_P6S14T42]OXX32510.1 DNA topoisomerase [Vibrio sp. V04_P4A5T148]OXX55743.1 DNA topoisomerase [Vibrio sp. V18_P1S4T112]
MSIMSRKTESPLFSAHGQALQHEPCPQCGGQLQLRRGKHGLFLGCNHYPNCDYIKPLQQNDGHIVKELGVPCPECGHELVLRQGRYGMFIGCSHYPHCHHIQDTDSPADNVPQSKQLCPECLKGHLVERKTRHGKTFHACDNYPKCKFAVNQQPVAGKCEKCGFELLIEKKLASGIKLQCADRKCGHIQSATE